MIAVYSRQHRLAQFVLAVKVVRLLKEPDYHGPALFRTYIFIRSIVLVVRSR